MAKKKRKMSAAQKAALAKGRAALARKRKASGGTKKRKTTTKSKTTAKRKTATKKTVVKNKPAKRSNPVAKKKGGRKKGRRVAEKARSFIRKSGAKGILMDAGAAVAGGVASGFIVNKLPISDPRIKSAAPIILGLALATTIGKRNKMLRSVGTGMVVLGTVSVIKQMAPQVPMLAGETDYTMLPNYAALPYAGETVDLGYSDFDDDEIATMGETVDLGEDVYVSPASI